MPVPVPTASTSGQRGVARPLVLALAVLTCVLVGSTVNRCLVCNPDRTDATSAAPPLQGAPLRSAKLAETPAPPPPEPEPVAEPEPAAPAPADEEGAHTPITFDKLASYVYKYPDLDTSDPVQVQDTIPESVRQLSGKTVSIQGFMIPIKLAGDQVTEFLLVRSQFFCCFGQVPKMNEWLHVIMDDGKTAPFSQDVPLTVFGKLDVGEVIENGVVMSLYRLKSDEVREPTIFR